MTSWKPLDLGFVQSMEKKEQNGTALHEIVILHKLIIQMGLEIDVLKKVVIHFDQSTTNQNIKIKQLEEQNEDHEKCIKKMKDFFLIMDQEQSYNKKSITELEKKLEVHTQSEEESQESNRTDENSPLTKKQRISRKKHERRKSKRIEQRIALSQEEWIQQNGGYKIGGLQYI